MTQIKISDPNLLTPSDFSKVRMELFEQISGSTYQVRYAAALTFLQLAIDAVSGGASVDYNTLKKIEDNVRDIWALINSGELGGGDIRTISLDGENIPIDENKNVDIELIGKYTKLDQTTKQTLSTSPIFSNLTDGRFVFVHTDGSLRDASTVFWDFILEALRAKKVVADNGSQAAPTFCFLDNINMGMYRAASNILGLSVNGSAVFSMTSTQLRSHLSGAAAAPAFTFSVDLDTGMFRAGTNILCFATNGLERGRVNANGDWGFGTENPTKKIHVGGTAGYVASGNEGITDLDFASRKTAKTFGKQQLVLAPATFTVWESSDFRDGQVKTSKATYYNETSLYYEQRFDWNEDLSVKRIEIKDDISGLWVQRNYTWTDGIPSISESTITAWTI